MIAVKMRRNARGHERSQKYAIQAGSVGLQAHSDQTTAQLQSSRPYLTAAGLQQRFVQLCDERDDDANSHEDRDQLRRLLPYVQTNAQHLDGEFVRMLSVEGEALREILPSAEGFSLKDRLLLLRTLRDRCVFDDHEGRTSCGLRKEDLIEWPDPDSRDPKLKPVKSEARNARLAERCILEACSGRVHEKVIAVQEMYVIVAGLVLTVSTAALLNVQCAREGALGNSPSYSNCTGQTPLQAADTLLWMIALLCQMAAITCGWCWFTVHLWLNEDELRRCMARHWPLFQRSCNLGTICMYFVMPPGLCTRLILVLGPSWASSSDDATMTILDVTAGVCCFFAVCFFMYVGAFWEGISYGAMRIKGTSVSDAGCGPGGDREFKKAELIAETYIADRFNFGPSPRPRLRKWTDAAVGASSGAAADDVVESRAADDPVPGEWLYHFLFRRNYGNAAKVRPRPTSDGHGPGAVDKEHSPQDFS